MTTNTTHLEDAANEAQSRAEQGDLPTRLSRIEQRYQAPRDRAAAFLEAIADSVGSLSAALTVAAGGEEHDLRHSTDTPGVAAWSGTLAEAALEARSHAKSVARLFGADAGLPEFAVIACPIDNAGRDPFGGVAIVVRCRSVPEAERLQLHLRSACLHAAGMLSRPANRASMVEMDDIARVYTRAGQFRDLHEFAYAITNAARQRFDCDQAAMGSLRAGRVRLLCISGLDTIKKRSPGVHRIEQAMGECADAAQPVVAQPKETWDESDFAEEGRLHLRWRAAADNACVLSVPVAAGDEIVAVVSFRRPADHPFDADDITAVQKLLAPLGGAIPLVTRSTRPLHRHAATAAVSAADWLLRKGSLRKRIAIACVAAAVGWAAIGTSAHRVNASATVVAHRERVVAAPSDGAVLSVLVRSGDRVRAGDELLSMDTAQLRLEAAQLEADLAATEARAQSAMAAGDTPGAAVARAERRAQAVRLAGIQRRIEGAVVRAPVAGVVVAPELADAQGRLVATGHPLLSIAEEGSLALEIRLPEGQVADLQPGSPVRFASHARPESPAVSALERIAPAAAERNGKQVFIAEASLPGDLAFLRPGMEGIAIIDAGDRPNWWRATHGLIDAARLRFWID
jgi:multidrug resistance efflux pump